MSQLIDQNLGKYRVLSRIGRGGMARVYKGHHPGLDRYVAIKVLHSHLAEDESFISRFEQEATAVARLRHPNIVQVYDFDEQDGHRYMVMEFVEGPTLKRELEERVKQVPAGRSPFTLEEIARIFIGLANAIDYAHTRGMVHRDLKPANVMLTGEGQVLLTDFGLAYLLGVTGLTETGAIAGTPTYMSPEQGQGKRGDERSDIYSLGVILYELLTGKVPFSDDNALGIILQHANAEPAPPSEHVPSLSAAVEGVVLTALAKDPAGRYQTANEMADALRAAVGLLPDQTPYDFIPLAAGDSVIYREITPGRNDDSTPNGRTPYTSSTPLTHAHPYRGLFAFREEDAPFFFGREEFTNRQLNRIEEQPLIAIVGPSGSGKSSVVFAGLIPSLREGGDWLISDFRPGSRPFQALAESLIPLLEPEMSEIDQLVETKKLAGAMISGDLALPDVVARILSKSPETERMLLVIDQFEELFTLCPSEHIQRTFLDLLLVVLEAQGFQQNRTLSIVLTIRADFLGQALDYRPLADALQQANLILGPMNKQELGRAIANPAGKLGISFEAGLINRILSDVGDKPGNLPLLEFALTLLWERRVGRRLTHSAYETIGRVEGALARYADEVYGKLSPIEQNQARRIFMQMVRPGQQTEDTRRVASRAELGEAQWALVQDLADARLLVTGRDPAGYETVEVVHEALIRSWSRLQEWLNTDRAFRIWQERLRASLRQWQISEHDSGALLRGVPLAEAEEWFKQHKEDLNRAERHFIQSSINHREQQRAEREKEAQARRQERRARARLQRVATWGLGIGLVIALVLAVLAASQWRVATQQRELADQQIDIARRRLSALLAAQSNGLISSEYDLALLLGVRASQVYITPDAQSSLLTTLLSNTGLVSYLRGHTEQINALAFNPDDTILASASHDGTIRLWNVATGRPSTEPLSGHEQPVADIAFHPTEPLLASAGNDGTVRVWDISRAVPTATVLEGHNGVVQSVTFSPDGNWLVSGGVDKMVRVWDVQAMALYGEPLAVHTSFVSSVAFSSDGNWLASGGQDDVVWLWEWEDGTATPTRQLTGHTDWVNGVAFSPDNQTLASASNDQQVLLWEVQSGELLSTTIGIDNWVRDVAFDPAGARLLTNDGANGATLWDSQSGQRLRNVAVSDATTTFAIALSRDGSLMAVGDNNGSVILWTTSALPAFAEVIYPPEPETVAVAYNETAQLMAMATSDGRVTIMDMSSEAELGVWDVGNDITVMQFSPDGSRLAVSDGDLAIRFWDVAEGAELETRLEGHVSAVRVINFSPDGKWLASGSDVGSLYIWDAGSLEVVGNPINVSGTVRAIAFHPNNRQVAVGIENNFTGFFYLWDVAEQSSVTGNIRTPSNVGSLSFDESGDWLAIGSANGGFSIYDFAAGDYLISQTTNPLAGTVNHVLFDLDDGWLVLADSIGQVMLWDIVEDKMVGQPFSYRQEQLGQMALIDGGDSLLSFYGDGEVVDWTLRLEDWHRVACSMANRDLTPEEWEQYFGDDVFTPTCMN